MLLINLAATYNGFIALLTVFFLKNRPVAEVTTFSLIMSIPLMLGIVFGFMRDRWSPFGKGDRAHLVVFGLLATASIVFGRSAQRPRHRGRPPARHDRPDEHCYGVAINMPEALSFAVGGVLSGAPRGQSAATAARGIYLTGATAALLPAQRV